MSEYSLFTVGAMFSLKRNRCVQFLFPKLLVWSMIDILVAIVAMTSFKYQIVVLFVWL
jgi:hypothetical protein